jgi:hypothetical protein
MPKQPLACPNARNPWSSKDGTAPFQAENSGSIPVARSQGNAVGRTFGEIRRRAKVIGRLPCERSCLGLV